MGTTMTTVRDDASGNTAAIAGTSAPWWALPWVPPWSLMCTKCEPQPHCKSKSAGDVQTCINVRPYNRRRCDIQKSNSISPPALKHAQASVHMIAGAETCINVSPYRLQMSSGAKICINVTPYGHRRWDMHKRKSISPLAGRLLRSPLLPRRNGRSPLDPPRHTCPHGV